MDLHGRIMNLPAKAPKHWGEKALVDAHAVGHAQARHAAAELVLKVDSLVDAARAVLAFRVDTPTRGDLQDNDKSRAALRALAAAVASIGDD